MRWLALLLLVSCTRSPAAAPDASASAIPLAHGRLERVSSEGGTAGDFFTVFPSGRRIQALDCGADQGGFSCIERVGPSSRRALVHYRLRGSRWVGDLDHLADAGDPACDSVTLERATPVRDLPSSAIGYSRLEARGAIAGDGTPLGWLDAGVTVRVVQQAVDADGVTWLEVTGRLPGWVPLDGGCTQP
ncbi:MAG: hypothetical protein QM723_40280 [Myxococcaceae bacterium]